jgi:hypothetical protein
MTDHSCSISDDLADPLNSDIAHRYRDEAGECRCRIVRRDLTWAVDSARGRAKVAAGLASGNFAKRRAQRA